MTFPSCDEQIRAVLRAATRPMTQLEIGYAIGKPWAVVYINGERHGIRSSVYYYLRKIGAKRTAKGWILEQP
jgi:hypothetical protein